MKRITLGIAIGLLLAAGAQLLGQTAIGQPGALATYLQESSAADAFGLSSSSGTVVFHCADRLVVKFNAAGTTRYYSLDLASGSGTWAHSTSSPC